jgi:SAM-dependent methyltransferase
MTCPVCSNARASVRLRRERIPVLQNVVYPTREVAMQCAAAPFALGECERCGFAFNAEFDESLVVYGADYDNDVPSPTFERYYREIAELLSRRVPLDGQTVYEVGCGKGTFLEMLCDTIPTVRAVGIDPSCTPRSQDRLELRRASFSPDEFEPGAKLVLLRHVLEHIGSPVAFLRELRKAVPAGANLYVEVPDLAWILQAGAFWDFCYEHCNYFTQQSLRLALSLAGFRVVEQATSFAGQYQWALCSPGEVTQPDFEGAGSAIAAYAEREARELSRYRALVAESSCITWGMATKGVMLNVLVPGLAGGVDINPKKQGRFAAVSGIEIHAPEWLKGTEPDKTVLVMNPTYEREIRNQIASLGVRARVIPV